MAYNHFRSFVLPLMLISMSLMNSLEARQLLEVTLPELPIPELPELPIPEMPELPMPQLPELPSLPELPPFLHFPELPKPTLPTAFPKDINPSHSTTTTPTP